VPDDHRPKIAARRENQQAHQNAKRACDRYSEQILVSVPRPEKRALHDACDYPRAAATAKHHGQALHKKAAKRELLVKPCSDQCIENTKNCFDAVMSQALEAQLPSGIGLCVVRDGKT
jgi:hypothetical protein